MPSSAEIAKAVFGPPPKSGELVELSLAVVEKRRGPSIFAGARLPVKEKSEHRLLARERKRRDAKMRASQFLHFPLKRPGSLAQVLEEYEYSLLIRAHQRAQPDHERVYQFPEQEWPQRAIDTVEAFRSVPGLQHHLEPLLRQVRWRDPYAIDMALCINQFLEWLRSNPNYIHFGPRLTGEIYGTINNQDDTVDDQSYLIRDSKVDDLVLSPNRGLTSEEYHLLNAIRVAGRGELGLTAAEVIARCYQDSRLRGLTHKFLAVEFKLGHPEDYGAVAEHHQRQVTNNTGLINSSLRQKGSSPYQDLLIKAETPVLKPAVGQLIYFAPNETVISQHHADRLKFEEGVLQAAVERAKIGQHLREHGNPIREQVEVARAQQEEHQERIYQIIKDHGDSPRTWKLFAELPNPLEPTAEIIRKAHAKQAISLNELIVVGGQIGIVWPSRDKALRIPLYDVPLNELFPETNEDLTLVVRPDKPEILIVTETTDKEIVLSLPVVDAEGQETSSELVLQAINMFLTLSPSLRHEPFTLHEEWFDVIEERMQMLQQRFHQNLIMAPKTIRDLRKAPKQERYAYLARRYLQKRGIPLEFATRHHVGCTVGWQEDLSACGLDGKEHLEDRLHLGISSGSIFLGEWPVLTAGLVTIPLYNPKKFIQSGERELIATAGRAIFPKMEPPHRVAIPPLMKEHVIEEKIILGDLENTNLILVGEGLLDSLTLRYMFELWGQSPYPCVIGNVGTAEMHFLEDLRQKYPDKLLLEAFDWDKAGRKAGTQIIRAGGDSLWTCVGEVVPHVPEDIKDFNELFLFLRDSNCPLFLTALVEYTQAIARRYTELWYNSS